MKVCVDKYIYMYMYANLKTLCTFVQYACIYIYRCTCTYRCISDVWMDGWTDGRMDEWMDGGRMDGWMDGLTDGWIAG